MCNYLAFCDCSAFIFFVCLSAVFLLLFRLLFLQCAVAPLFFSRRSASLKERNQFLLSSKMWKNGAKTTGWIWQWNQNERRIYVYVYIYIYEQHQVHPWKNQTEIIYRLQLVVHQVRTAACNHDGSPSTWQGKPGQTRGRAGQTRGRHGADTGQTGADTGQNSWSTNVTQNSWSKICNRCHHSFLGGDDSNALEHGKRLTWRCFVSGVFHAGGSKKAKI